MPALPRSNTPVESRFYSVRDVARMLGVSAMTVYRSIADGEVPAVRIRNRLIIPASAIDDMVRAAGAYTAQAGR